MTSKRLREIAAILEKYGDVSTSPVVLQGHTVLPVNAIDDLNRWADEIDEQKILEGKGGTLGSLTGSGG
jgi:Mg/Co/Ni transporter MgtE